jgi:hypothetical protein
VAEPAELVSHAALAALGTVHVPDLRAALRSQLPASLAAHVEVEVHTLTPDLGQASSNAPLGERARARAFILGRGYRFSFDASRAAS